MRVCGKYKYNDNFIYVFCGNCIYEISRKAGFSGFLRVGERDTSGNVLTQDRYDELEEECLSYGNFEVTEE